MAQCGCGCGGGAPKLIFCCSGAADIGAVADRASRKLSAEKDGTLVCLALLGSGSEGLALSAKGASKVLVMDGCPLDCARKIVEEKGISGFEHLRLTDLGLKKGECPPTEENVERVAAEGKRRLGSL